MAAGKIPFRALSLRLAVRCLLRQPGQTLVQTGAFALSFMLLGLLVMVRGDLIGRWQQQLPPDTPNYFLVNMTEEQIAPVNQLLASHNVTPSEYYPWCWRGCPVLTAKLRWHGRMRVSGQQHGPPRTEPHGRNRCRRSMSWWTAPGRRNREVSIEMEVVKELGLKVGDTLTFTGDTRRLP